MTEGECVFASMCVCVCVSVVAQGSDCGTAEEGIQTMSMWFIRD